jgi:tryptophan synthase alpha chain
MAANPLQPIMGHLVLGYPNLATSLETAGAYAAAGLRFLELQIPFSHPTADGPVITEANRHAIVHGTTVPDCLATIQNIHERHPAQTLVAMTYANRVFASGMDVLCGQLAASGVRHLIVPDLALDSPLAQPLWQQQHLGLVPVIGPNMTPERLEKLLARGPKLIYAMSGYKLTGTAFSLDPRLPDLIAQCRQAGAEVGIGFGIDSRAAINAVLEIADFAIVGSALIKAQLSGTLNGKLLELVQPAALA